jgi:hypothetical protein
MKKEFLLINLLNQKRLFKQKILFMRASFQKKISLPFQLANYWPSGHFPPLSDYRRLFVNVGGRSITQRNPMYDLAVSWYS